MGVLVGLLVCSDFGVGFLSSILSGDSSLGWGFCTPCFGGGAGGGIADFMVECAKFHKRD